MAEPIIDPHHHLWDLERFIYPWLARAEPTSTLLGNYGPLQRSYLIPDYLADIQNQNVVRSVHVEANHNPADPVAETRWLQGLADQHGYPHGIVAHVDLAAENAEAMIEGHRACRNLRGIRQLLNWSYDPGLSLIDRRGVYNEPRWRRNYGRLAHHGLTFDLSLNWSQLEDGLTLAQAFPAVTNVLNHVGFPCDRSPEGLALWRRGMRAIARAENVVVKLSGVTMTDHRWTVASLRPILLETVECFGPGRCMVASNFPVDRLYGSYDALYGAYREILAGFTAEERQQMFYGTAARVYRL